MASIAAATPVQAYQREASRLASQASRLTGKVVTRDVGVSLGPFSVRFTAKDYELDPTGPELTSSFADALDAADLTRDLGLSAATETAAPNALTRRQALASYRATQDQPLDARSVMFTATA